MQTTETHSILNTDTQSTSTLESARIACSRIAPVWPLDQFIAVNPWWERIDSPFEACADRVAALSGANFLMPRDYYQEKWDDGTIGQTDLLAAVRESGENVTQEALFAHLRGGSPDSRRMHLVTHALDSKRDLAHNMSWENGVTHQISQFCAASFDRAQACWRMTGNESLYPAWREMVAHERGIGLLMGVSRIGRLFEQLPEDSHTLIREALEALGIPSAQQQDYLEALLLSINGWASWCAYLRWQERLTGAEPSDGPLLDLLAIRLAWEWVLFQHAERDGIDLNWEDTVASWSALEPRIHEEQRLDWIWQHALEIAVRERLVGQLSRPVPDSGQRETPLVQAYFCIDVRSEVFRRALEGVDPRIQTGGFAGFFGLPVNYLQAGFDHARPQLPGLLSPALTVKDCCTEGSHVCGQIAAKRRRRLIGSRVTDSLRNAGTAVFSYVEASGLFYGFKLIKDGFFGGSTVPARAGLRHAEADSLKPRLEAGSDESATAEQAALAARILGAMSLTRDFPQLVLLAGHGSQSDNNPHAAGLDCGACCGQTGEVNARSLAALLNDPGVRAELASNGIEIPDTTRFIAALHNTTTDDVRLFDLDEVPISFGESLDRLRSWLVKAGDIAREERAANLNLSPADRGLVEKIRRRSRDWSQVRPEWGLAKNNSFIVAPRNRTRHLNLEGRSFLHDYDWQDDTDFAVLELIMTAPMVVTHWINMQYYASTVDNQRYGSGNKVLHNVVGGTIGVFEGNGGDLRTGLSMQSIHDGTRWMHEPVRLNVFIAAPRDAIRAIVEKHEVVRNLVNNKWIHLHQLDSVGLPVYAYRNGRWNPGGAGGS